MARRLDQSLLRKLAMKIGKDPEDLSPVNVRVSKLASRLSVSSEAALVVLSKRHGIGTANYQRSLPPSIQTEIRDVNALSLPSAKPTRR